MFAVKYVKLTIFIDLRLYLFIFVLPLTNKIRNHFRNPITNWKEQFDEGK